MSKKNRPQMIRFITQTPKTILKILIGQPVVRAEIDIFKTNLITLLDKINIIDKQPIDETEEHLKNNLRDFLRDTYYKDNYAINTKDKKDLVIHLDKTTDSEVGVIIEAKRPSNTNEMITAENPNKKAFHELILYYLDERYKGNNFQLKQLIITNIYKWYIIDANDFDKYIYNNTQIKNLYQTKTNDHKNNPFFYQELEKIIDKIDVEIPCIYFDIRQYDEIVRSENKENEKELIALYKIFSPQYLLKIHSENDSNSLNEGFYFELLHIIGVEEIEKDGKPIIIRKRKNRNPASVLEMVIDSILTEDLLQRIPDLSVYGKNKEEQIFEIALELSITWINRVLFLKLLEGQLITYHTKEKEDYQFLNIKMIDSFGELFKLFHKVLAVEVDNREEILQAKYQKVPYLNSSLFEFTDLENNTIKVNVLDNTAKLPLFDTSILKDNKLKINTLPTLEYFFRFLDAYNFSSESKEDIQEESKTIITASVLGKVFEKINGYKDGSVFTPSYITMYMCRQSIRLAVVQKFQEYCQNNNLEYLKINAIDDIYEGVGKYFDKKKTNEIINSLKICDPSVGSGHFLVSVLNEIIAIKSQLKVLIDENGKPLRDIFIEVSDDELDIRDEEDNKFIYNYKGKESNRIQKTIFHEKQNLIENCLFGVDINPNSVKICRLRLWIELLKSAYYYDGTKLQTLPNIDINIKCGNSLLSRFGLDADLSKALKSGKYDIKAYRGFVNDYKNEKNREVKRGLQQIIDDIKTNFRTEIAKYSDPRILKLQKLSAELFLRSNDDLFNKGIDKKTGNGDGNGVERDKIKEIEKEINQISEALEKEKKGVDYIRAFEWRFEFPEILSDSGEFQGFDLIIGNPPYIRHEEIKDLKPHLEKKFTLYDSTADILTYFFELGNNILKPQGILSLVVSNKFFRASYGKNLRNYLVKKLLLQEIIDFDKINVFPKMTVKVAIIQSKKEKLAEKFLYCNITEKTEKLTPFIKLNNIQFEQTSLSAEKWLFETAEQLKIYAKVNQYGTALSDKKWGVKINRGVLTGLNEAFLINEDTKNRLILEDENAEKIIKPLFRGRETEKYHTNFQNTYLILIPKGYTIKSNLPKKNNKNRYESIQHYGSMTLDTAWNWLSKSYPSIAKYLLPFKTDAEKRQDKGDYWWELRACGYYEDFAKPKIIWKRVGSKLRFCYDENGTYALDSTCIATGKHLKYLIGILNSKMIEYELNRFAPKTGTGDLIISIQALSPLQIPIPTKKQEKQIIDLVDKIIAKKEKNENTTNLEAEIDTLIYKMYDLTSEEISMIENEILVE
ncbi:MAG: class I SAM-dependent DNA methyltransferase [Cytophagia bacterium]|nr:MAG: class I SAM-dependent DNA methyltransferase [Cytophagia bacterium]TAG42493.1 MAG: class I SAM-dependent DNA methyltransferase [Cytophagia bacterium]